DGHVTGVQTCALPILPVRSHSVGIVEYQPGGPAALRCERRSSLVMLHNGVPMPPVSRTLAFFGSLASTVGTSRGLWAACLLLVQIGRASCRERGEGRV